MSDLPTLTDLLHFTFHWSEQHITAALVDGDGFTIVCDHPGWSGLDRCDLCNGSGKLRARLDKPTKTTQIAQQLLANPISERLSDG